MLDADINLLAVILATVSSLVVGTVWYAKSVFGNTWIKLTKVDIKSGNPTRSIIITTIVSFITAYVLAFFTAVTNFYYGNSFLEDALMTGFLLWLAFTAARFITHDAFENRPGKLTVLNLGNEFVTIMLMALIIGLIGV